MLIAEDDNTEAVVSALATGDIVVEVSEVSLSLTPVWSDKVVLLDVIDAPVSDDVLDFIASGMDVDVDPLSIGSDVLAGSETVAKVSTTVVWLSMTLVG